MKLSFNLRHAEKKDLHLEGALGTQELDLNGVDELVALADPFHYDLWVERLSDSVYVHGRVRFALDCQCARCLKPFTRKVDEVWSWDLPLEGEEKVAVENDCVDLTPVVREDILLAFPQHPLCKEDCGGLLTAPQKRSQQKNGAEELSEVSSAWAELNKLKL